ncbi:MAG: DUF2569 domain-containing protein [Synergistaceae bacterium]|jgi:hypothetical protein|nr:DUF2569 domain-containing protein [Synergistaceae bacterium]
MMDMQFTTIVERLVREKGQDALIDATNCKAHLADYAHNAFKKERHLLLIAIEADAGREIARADDLATCKKQLIRFLNEERFIDEELAAEAIDLLALVLRGDRNESMARQRSGAAQTFPPRPPVAPAGNSRKPQAPWAPPVCASSGHGETDATGKKNPEGLGGWLVLVGLGIIISPLKIIGVVFPVYSKMFSNGSWAALTTPGTEAYNPLWAPILYGEMAINGGLVLAWIFVAVLFFSKKKAFPKCYIGILLFTLVFIFIDALAIESVLPNIPVLDAETTKELGRSLVACLIWVPYMLVSKRVKATFVK